MVDNEVDDKETVSRNSSETYRIEKLESNEPSDIKHGLVHVSIIGSGLSAKWTLLGINNNKIKFYFAKAIYSGL